MILSTPAQDGLDYVMEEETLKIAEAEKQHDCVAVASDNLRQESSQVPRLGRPRSLESLGFLVTRKASPTCKASLQEKL